MRGQFLIELRDSVPGERFLFWGEFTERGYELDERRWSHWWEYQDIGDGCAAYCAIWDWSIEISINPDIDWFHVWAN